MPVRLNTIPDAESYPAPPARIKWLSALLLMLSVGVAITSLFASDELAKNGPHFWGLACGVPAFIWSLVASVRWLFFITQYIRADAWNKRREEVILQETRRGRRALQILSFSVQTALNGDSVAETTAAFLARQQVLNTYVDLRGEDTVRRSVIPVLTNKPVTGTDVNSQLLLKLYTEDAAEARGWLPGGQLHSDLLVLLRVYLGWRCQARLQLTLPVSLLPAARLGKQRVQISRTGILRASFVAPATGTVTVSLGCYQGLIPALSIRNRESMTHVSYSF
ncbi:type VI secretion system baseplate subunit TssG [Escherichia coli]|nr:hypothetical protein [Escherichia coli]MCV9068329.1 type VI secretion system baseplate subunit TssG [Escherichia coli]